MEKITKDINGINYTIKADSSLIPQTGFIFDAVKSIPPEKMRNGFQLEVGFSLLVFSKEGDGYKIITADYMKGPYSHMKDDLSIDLKILDEQVEMVRYCAVNGISARFDERVDIAKDALLKSDISLQRYSDIGENHSGWYIEALQKDDEGDFVPVPADEYECTYIFELLKRRPALMKVLALPYDYIVVFHDDEIIEILDENDNRKL